MSWIKRIGLKNEGRAGSPSHGGSPAGSRASPTQTHSRAGSSGSNVSDTGAITAFTVPQTRPRAGTDPDTCCDVFKCHWGQAWSIIYKQNGTPQGSSTKRNISEDIEAVTRYVDQMMLLLVEERDQNGGQGPILQYLLEEDILEKLLSWGVAGEENDAKLKLHHLKMFEFIIGNSQQMLFVHKPIVRPLLKLLCACEEHPNKQIQQYVILILHQLCVCVTQNTQLLEVLFSSSSDHGPAKFLIFSLLIPYIHEEGNIGQQARDALLLIMSLTSVHEHIGKYIADNSDFCPVLATGLSGLYSRLPRKIDIPADDWHQLTWDDIKTPELTMFLNSLEFCNAVVQVAHPCVKQQLLTFIYNGFLIPVIGPALHQSSMDEVIAATAYLELFIRKISEPSLMQTFLKFITTAKFDDVYILDSLIVRINSNTRLCMVTLALFSTLIDLNCEDFMFQLVLKYLIPCTHVMVSQRRAVKDIDLYSKTADKLLSLKPACVSVDPTDTPPEGMATPMSIETESIGSSSPTNSSTPNDSPAKRSRLPSWMRKKTHEPHRSSSPDRFNHNHFAAPLPPPNERVSFESHYLDYLINARAKIAACADACRCWGAPYDGENPSPDSLLQDVDESFSADISGISELNTEAPPAEETNKTNQDNCDNSSKDSESQTQKPDVRRNLISSQSSDTESANQDSGRDSVPDLPAHADVAKLSVAPHSDSCADSIISEADSAFSGCSSIVENTGQPHDNNTASRADSPLNDNFKTEDFNTFLLTLKRVKTPVEFSESLDDTLTELDSLIEEYKQYETPKKTTPKHASDPKRKSSETAGKSLQLSLTSTPIKSSSSSMVVSPSVEEKLAGFTADNKSHIARTVSSPGEMTGGHALGFTKGSISTPVFTPTKYNLGKPDIGPFLTTIMQKLESMMSNTLYVNLLLTGIVTRLACYPQPLLRSFLLNHALVFQPTVKSLVQVLGSVKHKVDCYSYTVKDFDSLMWKARHFLAVRDEQFLHHADPRKPRADSTLSLQGLRKPSVTDSPKSKKRGSIGDFFFRRNSSNKTPTPPRLTLDHKGVRYLNRQNSPTPSESGVDMEALKTKNAVYCALVLEEFVKELAAVSQEHCLVNVDYVH